MIHKLRRQHRITIVLLVVVLTIVFIAGMLVRKPAPINPTFPKSLLPATNGAQL